MARLGGNALAAGVDVTIYTSPPNQRASVSVNLCNRSASDEALVRLALVGSGGALSTTDYIEYDIILPPNGTLERTGIIISNGQFIVARSSTPNVTAVIWGIEEQV